MQYRAVGDRCAVALDSFCLPVSDQEALAVLSRKGFSVVEVDVVALARQRVGISQYRRGARLSEAPAVVDCSSFVKWLYSRRGIWLPRRSIQQRGCGEVVEPGALSAGDVVFVSGWIDYYHDNPDDGVGHVGIYTGDQTVVHAANKKFNVIETPFAEFIGESQFRGARRYVPKDTKVLTLATPSGREVEIADDVRWIILQALPR